MADTPNPERQQEARDLRRQQAELAKEKKELNSLMVEILKVMKDATTVAGE
jgi:hypothetical protein